MFTSGTGKARQSKVMEALHHDSQSVAVTVVNLNWYSSHGKIFFHLRQGIVRRPGKTDRTCALRKQALAG